MPDLSTEAIRKFWKSHEDPSLYRIITFLESVEDCTLDGDEDIEASLAKLGAILDDLSFVDIGEL